MKKIIICVLALVLITSLVACSKKNNSEQPSEEVVCTEELIYKLNDDGKAYTLISVGKCTCENIVIPETYNGLPVTSIGDSAFNRCYTVKSITLPSSVTEIWHRAFANCYQLESVNIPSGVTGIGFYVFSGCKALRSVIIPSSVAYIGGDLFNGCTDITVNCEAESQPAEWESNWSSGVSVKWGYTE